MSKTAVFEEYKAAFEKYVSKGSISMTVGELLPAERDEWLRRDKELHPSSFPFCGLRNAYERFTRPADPSLEIDFGRDYFLPAGHVFHAAVQKWIGFSGVYIGNWVCLSCSRRYELQGRPKRCKCGSHHLQYEELGGKWGKTVSWHTDGLFRTRNHGLWLNDFKTTSTYAIYKHKKENTFPYVGNEWQIKAYVPLVEDLIQEKLAGYMLTYAARDNPSKPWNIVVVGSKITDSIRAQARANLELSDQMFKTGLAVKKRPNKTFKLVSANKLCSDRDFYNEQVKNDFEPCPLAKVCFNKTRLQKALQEAIDERGSQS